MKIIKKITSISFIVCIMMSIMLMNVYAATGRVSFTDLNTAAGEEFKITIRTKIEGANIDSIQMELDYDSSVIEFISGDDISEIDNTLIIDKTSEIETSDISLEASFLALKEAETSITIKSVNVVDTEGTQIQITQGSSAIRIVGGTEVEQTDEETDEQTDEQTDEPSVAETIVTVKGEEYTIVSEFQESSLPLGYVKSKLTYNGEEYTAAKSEVGNSTLVLLTDQSGKADFFQYNAQENSFSPFVRVNISDTSYIIFTDEPITLDLSEQYIEKTLTINNFIFPTWEDTKNPGFYLIHAYDNSGQLGIYQYDTVQQTYQRSSVPANLESENTNKELAIKKFIVDNIVVICIIVAIVFLIMLSVIIVLTIRLWKAKSHSSKYERESISDIYEKPSPSLNEKEIQSKYDEYDDTFEYSTHVQADTDQVQDEQVVSLGQQQINNRQVQSTDNYYQENHIFEVDEFEDDEYYSQLEDEYVDDGFDDSYKDEFEEKVQSEIGSQEADKFDDEFVDEFQDPIDDEFQVEFDDEFDDEFDNEFEDELVDGFEDELDDEELDDEELEKLEDSEYEFVEMLLEEEPEVPKRKRLSFRKGKK